MPPTIHDHVAVCATLHCCTTSAYVEAVLNYSTEAAKFSLRQAAAAGLLRRVLLPGTERTAYYQPTAKAAGIRAYGAPKFLRAGVPTSSLWRGVLRGGVVFVSASDDRWLTMDAAYGLLEQHGIMRSGYVEPLIAMDHAGRYHIYVPVLPSKTDIDASVIFDAAHRWLPILEDGKAHLHFIATAGRSAEAIRTALAQLVPTNIDAAKLAEINARIASDKTGVAMIELARERAELTAALITSQSNSFPWLMNSVVEVSL
jgi:hypothetical protein